MNDLRTDPALQSLSEVSRTVLIPTYRRPDNLTRCLQALLNQSLLPNQVLVVRRFDDLPSKEVVDGWASRLSIKDVCVTLPGQVHALNSGLDWITQQIGSGIVCILDDDTAPHQHWLSRIATIFDTEGDVGGVGGRDFNFAGDQPQLGEASRVGTILWYGRFAGNHHLGVGPRRDVDYLKGANMSYRLAAIGDLRFDKRFLGTGAQVHNDLAFSMGVRNRGFRLVYDPEASVDHFSAERFDSDTRGAPSIEAAENTACNFYLTLRCYVQPPWRRAMTLLYARVVGLKHTPGLLRGLYYRLRSNKEGVAFRTVAIRAWQTARSIEASTHRAG